jgi:hypothetical protein
MSLIIILIQIVLNISHQSSSRVSDKKIITRKKYTRGAKNISNISKHAAQQFLRLSQNSVSMHYGIQHSNILNTNVLPFTLF